MQLTMNLETFQLNKKINQNNFIVLTDRDLEIIKFILEMKFCSVNDIHQRFFKVNPSGTESLTNRSAYRRLLLLEVNDYLVSCKCHITGEKLYFPSAKGYYLILRSNTLSGSISYPIKKIDYRTFEHDHKLIQIRYDLERSENVKDWKSDRYLKSKTEFNELSALNIVPDAIYSNSYGENIALELELTLKSKERYKLKIKSIVDYIRGLNSETKAFQKVRFLCGKKSIFETLSKETKIYSKYFQIENHEA